MEFIKPPEIASKIMTLMDEAEERIIIISPYNKLSNWKKIRNHFEKAQARGVTIEYYIRANEKGNKEEVRQLGIEPVEIDNLHAKVYLNDETAIVTSLNLHQFSDENSIDIGYKTETAEEYKEVYEFYTRYVVSEINKEIIVDYNQSSIDGFLEYFFNSLVTIYTKYAFTIKEPRSSDWGSITCNNFHIEGLNLETTLDLTIQLRNRVIKVNSASLSRVSQSLSGSVEQGPGGIERDRWLLQHDVYVAAADLWLGALSRGLPRSTLRADHGRVCRDQPARFPRVCPLAGELCGLPRRHRHLARAGLLASVDAQVHSTALRRVLGDRQGSGQACDLYDRRQAGRLRRRRDGVRRVWCDQRTLCRL